jgi:hypothetical protein
MRELIAQARELGGEPLAARVELIGRFLDLLSPPELRALETECAAMTPDAMLDHLDRLVGGPPIRVRVVLQRGRSGPPRH